MDHNNEFMIGHEGVPASPALAQAAYERGWCRRCGRRLSYVGKCPNCDAWWRSGYVMVGLPLLLLNLGGLSLVAARYGHKPTMDIAAQTNNSGSLLATQPVFPSITPNTHYAPSYQPTTYSSVNSMGATMGGVQAPYIMPDPWGVRLQELQNLRSMVWEAEAQYHQQQEAPTQYPARHTVSISTTSEKTSRSTMNAPS
jgi:hypothetical protein